MYTLFVLTIPFFCISPLNYSHPFDFSSFLFLSLVYMDIYFLFSSFSFYSITGITTITESQIITIIMMMVITGSTITSLLLPPVKIRSLLPITILIHHHLPRHHLREVLFEQQSHSHKRTISIILIPINAYTSHFS